MIPPDCERDNRGRIKDCYFYAHKNKQVICKALVKFYNYENVKDMCGNCPFFKTPEEYLAGMRNKRGDADL